MITQGNPSAIYGTLNSNGNVYLINPSGILVGPSGVINTNGFTASTLDIPDHEFLNGGPLHFEGDSLASVINQGTITTGPGGVLMIGNQIINEGLIESLGNINLIDGGSVTLDGVGTFTQPDLETLKIGISETAGYIQNSGTIRATGTLVTGGEVYLVAPGGEIMQEALIAASKEDAGGNLNGGEIVLSGEDVTLDGELSTPGGDVLVSSDQLALNGSIDAGNGTVTLQPETADRTIDLGGETAESLSVTDAEIDKIKAGVLRIGSTESGNINVTGAIAPEWVDMLSLITGGGVRDANENGKDFTLESLAFRTADGIGEVGNPLDTEIDYLAFVNTAGGLYLSNKGRPTITALDGIFTSINLGDTSIAASSPLTIGANVIAAGDVTLTALETNDPGTFADVLTINAGVTVQSTGGNVNLNAGDDIIIGAGATISAAGTVALNAGFGDLDGQGAIMIDSTATLTGDTFTVTALGDVLTQANLAFNTLNLNANFGGALPTSTATTVNVLSNMAEIQDAIDIISAGGTINVSDGTYNENLTIDKSITLDGESRTGTILDPGAGNVITVSSGGVTIQDLLIQNAVQGIRYEAAGMTLDGNVIDNVHISNMSSRGVEVHNATTMTNFDILNSCFTNTGTSIRFASSAVGDGVTIDNTMFDGGTLGFYQANDGSTGNVNNLMITGSSFENFTDTAVFAEEIRNSTIDDNTYMNNRRGITIFKNYTAAGVNVENLTISNNTFTNHDNSSILYFQANSGLAGPVNITGNTINQDVGELAANWATIDVRLESGFTHGPVNINQNNITFSGTFGAATAAYGIQVRGASDMITISKNTLDGGNVGSMGGVPPTSGIFVRTNDVGMGAMANGAIVDINQNIINNFDNGISVYDSVNSGFGGLPSNFNLFVFNNDLSGNMQGIVSGAGGITNATTNWWGSNDEDVIAAYNTGPVDFSSYFLFDTDTMVMDGFQGDGGNYGVTTLGEDNTGVGRIQNAINLADVGGYVFVNDGTYNENLSIFKDLTLDGESRTGTILDANNPMLGFDIGILVTSGNVTIQDLRIDDGQQGIRYEAAGMTLDGNVIDNVHISNMSSRGVEVHNATTMTNFDILNSCFTDTATGIRFASNAIGDGVTIDNTMFDGGLIGFYQANEGSTGYVNNLEITNSSFDNWISSGIFLEEFSDVLIDNNTFTGNRFGVFVFNIYDNASRDADITISNNTFTDHTANSIGMWTFGADLVGPWSITGNTINQNVGVLNEDGFKEAIEIRTYGGNTHGPINITSNEITFSGTLSGVDAAYGISLLGTSDDITISKNILDGGSIGNNGGTPPTSGIYIETNGDVGVMASTAEIDITNNFINNFVNGVSVYDSGAGAFGGIPMGAQVNVNENSLAGNTLGVASGMGETVNASYNWWGTTDENTVFGMTTGPVDITPFLLADSLQVDCFVGDFDNLFATTLGEQTGMIGRIQEGINLVNPDGTLYLGEGTFTNPEQVVIDKNVDIIGSGKTDTIVTLDFDTGSGGDSRGWWLVESGVVTNLSDFTMDGNGQLVWQAIRHRGSGSIDNMGFENILYNPSSDYQGSAIVAFGDGPVDVTNSMFMNIGRIGTFYFGSGVSGSTYANNMYIGKGVGDWIDYGVEVGAGAANIQILNNSFSYILGVAAVDNSVSAGVFLSTAFGDGSSAFIGGNTFNNNSNGVIVGSSIDDSSAIEFGAGNQFMGGENGIRFTGNDTSLVGNTFNDIKFSGLSGNYIELTEGALFEPGQPTILDASNVMFEGQFANLGNQAAIEAKIVHFMDDPTLGLIFPGTAAVGTRGTGTLLNDEFGRYQDYFQYLHRIYEFNDLNPYTIPIPGGYQYEEDKDPENESYLPRMFFSSHE